MEKGCARRLLSDLSRRGCSRFSLAMCLRSLAMSFRWTIAVAIRTSAFVVLCRFHSLLILRMKVKRVSSAAVQRYGTSTRSQSDIHRSFRSLSVLLCLPTGSIVGFQVEFLRWHPTYCAVHVAKLAHPFRKVVGVDFLSEELFQIFLAHRILPKL